jgi:hypothetical protein
MFMREANKLNLGSVTTRNKAIKWWDKLSKSQKFQSLEIMNKEFIPYSCINYVYL